MKKTLNKRKEKQEKSIVRKVGGTVEKAPIVNKSRAIKPKGQKKINLELIVEEEVNEDFMILSQIIKQTLE